MNKTLIQPIFTSPYLPNLLPQQVVLLNINIEDQLRLPIVRLIAKTLNTIFTCRVDKKAFTLFNTRAQLEASVMLLRKTRHGSTAEKLQTLVSQV